MARDDCLEPNLVSLESLKTVVLTASSPKSSSKGIHLSDLLEVDSGPLRHARGIPICSTVLVRRLCSYKQQRPSLRQVADLAGLPVSKKKNNK